MFYYLVGALKRRLILELQNSFQDHPLYSKIVPFIQNKFAFPERPQFGIVIKGSSANKVQFSPDNFLGTVQSHVMLTYVGPPAHPIEWVKENLIDPVPYDVFPTAPGVYYLEILSVPTNPEESGSFIIDPLLTVTDEAVLQFLSGIEREAQLQNIPVRGTVRLWVNRHQLLKENTDFSVNYQTGAVSLLGRFDPNSLLTADYRYAAPSIGPVNYSWNLADTKTLPGVVMAFGKRGKVGDKVAIVVYRDRVDTANAYGGKFEATFDVDVISQDVPQMEEIADLSIMYLWAIKKPQLEFEGIEIVDISMGGESEEQYDEQADLFYYIASLSIQLRADWEMHVSLPLTFSRVTTEKSNGTPGIASVPSGLYFSTVPVLVGRNNNFERIK